jgi:hypothetical protein
MAVASMFWVLAGAAMKRWDSTVLPSPCGIRIAASASMAGGRALAVMALLPALSV